MAVKIKENVALAPYTIYKIGGPARYFTEARNAAEAEEAARFAVKNNAPFFVLGAGSNTLISDKGFDGLIIRMAGGEVKVEGELVTADAGVMMARLASEAARAGLAGFEWGIGIPGTIGGSVRGNAGCFGGEMRDVVETVEIFDAKNVSSFNPRFNRGQVSECGFGYRDSIFKKHPEWIVLSATLKLQKGDPAAIQNEIKRITAERSEKQDIGTKSCGCIFKNPTWPGGAGEKEKLLRGHPELSRFAERATIPASFLIDRAGLKGEKIGAIVVSDKHANFFVNEGGAAASDVRALVALAKEKVRSLFDVALEEEIQYVGF
ncbi:MAG: UDP-N-acetylmuramate dehydrogenase [Patescibacteria group bacterium]